MSRLFLYGLLLISTVVSGQVLTPDIEEKYEVYRAKIKQFDDFANRFNGTSTDTSDISDRRLTLLSLFNHEDPRFIEDSQDYSPEYVKGVKEFIETVLKDSLTIDKNSENIHAKAETHGMLDGKAVTFHILLKQEQVGKDMLKWVILDVEAAFLEVLESDTTMMRFLPPTSGELDFKELLRAMKDEGHQHEYAHRDYRYDGLSVYFYLLNSGHLQLESVQEVQYLVYDIPGWCMVLKDFNRNSKNAGWLIHDLKRR